MPPSKPKTPADWRAWLALAWAIWFGAQYVEMVAASRATKAIAIIKALVATVR